MKNLLSCIQKTIIELGAARSSQWKTVRNAHLQKEGFCRMCGSTKDLQVHHMLPFVDDPTKELDDSNLITLCESSGIECHLKHGHLGNWHQYNPRIQSLAIAPESGVPAPGYINLIDQNIVPVEQPGYQDGKKLKLVKMMLKFVGRK